MAEPVFRRNRLDAVSARSVFSAFSVPETPVSLLVRKRDGHELSPGEIGSFVDGFVRGTVADYQMSAFLMAALLRGMTDEETLALTDAMLHSGRVLTLPSVKRPKVDKHSTGGVGDKISLCLAPAVAACGVAVPMISGRGLGHTGGTLDKLEAIPGYRTRLSVRDFERIVARVGTSLIGQTDDLAPADRRMYALRDVTGTVESIPLIVASILSKKLAEGIDGLVLDVKCGGGAFMKDLPSAKKLANALCSVGRRAGKTVSALVTDMSTPTGVMIGNALEVKEALDVLRGGGPADTEALTAELGAEMLALAGTETDRAHGRARIRRSLSDGSALEVFRKMVHAHGGDVRTIDDPRKLPRAPHRVPVLAPRGGHVTAVDALALGLLAVSLGAGRTRADLPVDPGVGIELVRTRGSRVEKGEPLAFLHLRKKNAAFVEEAARAFVIGRAAPRKTRLVLGRM
ncbi:MAG TPA: thymidine phosphorylase [Polyangiaceae bacterium]|nr:thymidine phosphorylase [Polyangiaceae bacterium]